jgi:hypothetical protein
MKGDFSRFTFDPSRHFSAVRLQQGRVQLDADWNEQVDITDHRIATEITDFIGQSGAPEQNAGFQVKPGAAAATLAIGRGRYYVEGRLFQFDADVPFESQPDFPGTSLPTAEGRYVAYLDAWQHHVTGREDPRLLDPALGDADTATRVRNVAQVKLKLLTTKDGMEPKDFFPPWQPPGETAIGSGRLAARMSAPRPTMENQLYRVEIHRGGGPAQATFKWSRDNGAVTARVKNVAGTAIVLRAGGRSAAADFAPNQWVEVISQPQVLRGEPGTLAEIAAVQDDTITVVEWPAGAPPAVDESAVVRRWDSAPGEIALAKGPILLEDGIEVVFDTDATVGGIDVSYRTGDYWVFPSRSLTGTIEWPQSVEGIPVAVRPHGVRHRYCALALLTLKGKQWNVDADLRVVFKPIGTGLVSKGGDTITGGLNVLGRVGIGTAAPTATLEIDQGGANDVALKLSSSGVGRGAGLLLNNNATGGHKYAVFCDANGNFIVSDETGGTTKVLFLIDSQGRLSVSGANIRIGGDTAGGPPAGLSVTGDGQFSGTLTFGNPRLAAAGAEENLRIVRGCVLANGRVDSGRGFTVKRVQNNAGAAQAGLYDIVFNTAFAGRPSASVNQVFNRDVTAGLFGTDFEFVGDPNSVNPNAENFGSDPRNTAIIVILTAQFMRLKLCDQAGAAKDRNFAFIVVGPR